VAAFCHDPLHAVVSDLVSTAFLKNTPHNAFLSISSHPIALEMRAKSVSEIFK
jgi:hypothetical protein